MESNNSAKGGSASGGKKISRFCGLTTDGERSRTIRTLKGVVVSDKMQKTVIVAITRLKKHPKYKKYYKVTKRYKAHDEKSEYHTGDKVVMQAIKPMSKEKRWMVVGKS